MGLIRTSDCAAIDREMDTLFPGRRAEETKKDEYSEDFVVWIVSDDEIHSIRVTIDEYRDGDWRDNLRQALELL